MSTDDSGPDSADYILDLSTEAAGGETPGGQCAEAAGSRQGERSGTTGRPFLSIYFKCCNTYARIYKTPDGKAYAGRCPRCAKAARIAVGPGGTTARFFSAE